MDSSVTVGVIAGLLALVGTIIGNRIVLSVEELNFSNKSKEQSREILAELISHVSNFSSLLFKENICISSEFISSKFDLDSFYLSQNKYNLRFQKMMEIDILYQKLKLIIDNKEINFALIRMKESLNFNNDITIISLDYVSKIVLEDNSSAKKQLNTELSKKLINLSPSLFEQQQKIFEKVSELSDLAQVQLATTLKTKEKRS